MITKHDFKSISREICRYGTRLVSDHPVKERIFIKEQGRGILAPGMTPPSAFRLPFGKGLRMTTPLSLGALLVSIFAATIVAAQDSVGTTSEQTHEDTVFVLRPTSEGARASDSPKDTVVVLTRQNAEEFLHQVRPMPDLARKKGYGGCLGPTMGVLMLDTEPIDQLLQDLPFPDIRNRIDGPTESFPLFGGMLYGGVGHGTRIGLAGNGGSRSFGVRDGDTVHTAQIGLGYGGFMVEKSIVVHDLNLILGGLVGAGGMGVTVTKTDWNNAFQSGDDLDAHAQITAGAAMFVIQLHGGFTYSILPWFHAGIQGVLPVFYSGGGFRFEESRILPLTDPFLTVNGGVQVRIVLGNIG